MGNSTNGFPDVFDSSYDSLIDPNIIASRSEECFVKLFHSLNRGMKYSSNDLMNDLMNDSMNDLVNNTMHDTMNDSINNSMHKMMKDLMNDSMNDSLNDLMNSLISDWIDDSINDLMEWFNERLNVWFGKHYITF